MIIIIKNELSRCWIRRNKMAKGLKLKTSALDRSVTLPKLDWLVILNLFAIS